MRATLPPSSLSERVHDALRGLSPGYFALVMATGIDSVGLRLQHRDLFSTALLAFAAAAFVVLLLLTAWRFAVFRRDLVEDFTDPHRGFGFYSFVAAANVLGVRLVMDGRYVVPVVLLGVSAVAWLARGYAVPWTTHRGRAGRGRPIVTAANGTWFMWAVSGQSIAVAAAALVPHWPHLGLPLTAAVAWALGVFLYAVDGVFVAMRLLAYDFSAEDLTPPYWIATGAAAITVLAGARLLQVGSAPAPRAEAGLVRGVDFVLWAVATWLVPALFAMGWWRHVTHRVPLRYEPNLWCIVFPLGMYSVACTYLGRAEHLPAVQQIGAAWLWLALVAWVVTAAWMLVHVVATVLLGVSGR